MDCYLLLKSFVQGGERPNIVKLISIKQKSSSVDFWFFDEKVTFFQCLWWKKDSVPKSLIDILPSVREAEIRRGRSWILSLSCSLSLFDTIESNVIEFNSRGVRDGVNGNAAGIERTYLNLTSTCSIFGS